MSETDIQIIPAETPDETPQEAVVVEMVEVEIVEVAIDNQDEDEDEEEEYQRALVVLREVIERQLFACRTLGSHVTDAATDITAAVVESPARVIAAVHKGATLPRAFGQTGGALQDAAMEAGSRIRAAVGNYVNSQAALPDALIAGTAEVAGSVVRAQGAVTTSALDAVFTVATAATSGSDVRDAFDQEWRELSGSVAVARGDIADAIDAARQNVRVASPL